MYSVIYFDDCGEVSSEGSGPFESYAEADEFGERCTRNNDYAGYLVVTLTMKD